MDDEKWRSADELDESFDEYAWSMVPCPHCDDGILLGVHDPDEEFDDREVTLVTLTPPEDDTDD